MIKKRISDFLNGEVKISKFRDIQNKENKVYKIILDDENNKVINLYVLQNVRIVISGHTCFSVLKNNQIIEELCFQSKNLIRKRGLNLDRILNKGAKNGLPLKSNLKLRFSNLRRKKTIDEEVLDEIRSEIITQGHAVISRKIQNTDRSLGARISGELSYLFGHNNFKGSLQFKLTGVAGQSFGAFLSKGIELRLKGLANDYIGKSMSSGIISIRNSSKLRKKKRHNTLIGNVALYGSTGGELYVAGSAAERFAVRNSGATAVVEGVGNHGCEYMTQGIVIILGSIGKNFGAGMTGGRVYLYSKFKSPKNYINHDFLKQKR